TSRARELRNETQPTPTESSEIVEMTTSVPVTDWSLCVMPCCTRSPSTTSRITSNGSSELSSRRPTTRVIRNTKKKTTVARMTRSMAQGKIVSERCTWVIAVEPSSSSTSSRRLPTFVGLTWKYSQAIRVCPAESLS